MEENSVLLECRRISKTFPGVKALDNVDFTVCRGEIHGLVGENGAGKSTLMKIISGVYSPDAHPEDPDAGLYFEGQKVLLRNPKEAIGRKIMTIHQELTVVPHLNVYENIYLNHELKARSGFINRKQMLHNVRQLLDNFEVDVDPKANVGTFSVDKQKIVEILRALSQDAKLLILDEPTSFLTDSQTEKLLDVIKNIRDKDIGVVFISHNINEVVNLSDRVSIICDGQRVGELDRSEASTDKVVRLMIKDKGKLQLSSEKTESSGELLLDITDLSVGNKIKSASFSLRRGEILGITGIIGAGGTALAKTLFADEGFKKSSGTISIEGKRKQIRNTGDAIQNRIVLLTKDRKNEGLFLSFNLFENVTIPSLSKFRSSFGLLSRSKQIKATQSYMDKLYIKARSPHTRVETLSGGNQQKVVISKWLEADPLVLILDEPTVGIDIGAKFEIRKIIRDLAKAGKGIIIITSEYEELESMCNRVLVMFKGRIVKELAGDQVNRTEIRKHLSGDMIQWNANKS